MGLSSEERVKKLYWALIGWRFRLTLMVEALREKGRHDDGLDNPRGAGIVQGWIDQLNMVLGRMVTKSNFSSGYWLFGPNEDSFRELHGDHYGLGNYSKPEDGREVEIQPEASYGSLKYWQHTGFAELARRLTSGKFLPKYSDEAISAGLWWDQFDYVDAILYPLDRYRDGLFDYIRDDLIRLIGDMVARRFDLQKQVDLSDRADFHDCHLAEQALLCKHKVLMYLLADAEKQQNPPNGPANVTKLSERARAAWQKRDEELYTGSFDIGPLIEQVGVMSLSEVETFLDQRSRQEYNSKQKFRDEQYGKEEKKRHQFSGLTGPMARTEKEIQHILDTTTDAQEYEKAYQERQRVYNTSGGFGETWAEVLKRYPKAAKLGAQAAYEEQSARLNNARKRKFVGTVPKNRLVQAVKDVRAICKGMGIKAANEMLQGKPWALPDEKTRKALVAKMKRYGLTVEWADKK